MLETRVALHKSTAVRGLMSFWGCKTCNRQKKIGNLGLLLKFAIVHVPRKDRHRVMDIFKRGNLPSPVLTRKAKCRQCDEMVEGLKCLK